KELMGQESDRLPRIDKSQPPRKSCDFAEVTGASLDKALQQVVVHMAHLICHLDQQRALIRVLTCESSGDATQTVDQAKPIRGAPAGSVTEATLEQRPARTKRALKAKQRTSGSAE